MTIAIEISDELVGIAKLNAAAKNHFVSEQIECWARIGRFLLGNLV